MKIRTVLKPGKRGTKALVKEYGSQLVCVRYRYDYANNKRYKTVELVISEEHWQPPIPLHPDEDRPKQLDKDYSIEDKVKVRIDWDESMLQKKAKQYGGIWSPKDKIWLLNTHDAINAGLAHRIIDSTLESSYK